jgi:alpha-L-fucosidase 2
LCHAQDGGALKLWCRQPAGAWTEVLPVRNGRLAAMVFGTVRKEHIQLNEDTVWSGEKRDRSNPEAPQALAQIRRLLVEGHPAQAQALADKTMISIPRALPVCETLGDLWLDFGSGPFFLDYPVDDSERHSSDRPGRERKPQYAIDSRSYVHLNFDY